MSKCLSLTILFTFVLAAPPLYTAPLGYKLVADINQQPIEPSSPLLSTADLTVYQDKFYFTTATPHFGTELWSKSLQQEPKLVADINPGVLNANPRKLSQANQRLYFIATQHAKDQLWVVNMEAPPALAPLNSVELLNNLSVHDYLWRQNSLYLLGYQGQQNSPQLTLWRQDGNTPPMAQLALPIDNQANTSLFYFGNALHILATSSQQTRLLRIDGNQYTDLTGDAEILSSHQFIQYQERLFVAAKQGTYVYSGKAPPELLHNIAGPMAVSDNVLFIADYRDDGPWATEVQVLYRYQTEGPPVAVSLPAELIGTNSYGEPYQFSNISLAGYDQALYVFQTAVENDGDWVYHPEQTLFRYIPENNAVELMGRISQHSAEGFIYEHNKIRLNGNDVCIGTLTSNSQMNGACLSSHDRFHFLTAPNVYSSTQNSIYTSQFNYPSHLFVTGDELKFFARTDTFNNPNLWRLSDEGSLHALEAPFVSSQQARVFGDNIAFINAQNVHILDPQGQQATLDDLYTELNIQPDQLFSDSGSLYILTPFTNNTREVWRYDGTSAPKLMWTLDSEDSVYISGGRLYQFPGPKSKHCVLSETLVDGTQKQLLNLELPSTQVYCASWMKNVNNEIYFHIEGDHTSFGTIHNSELQLIWQNSDYRLANDTLLQFGGQLYFCLAQENGDAVLATLDEHNLPTQIATYCPLRPQVANLNGTPAMYFAHYNSQKSGIDLYQMSLGHEITPVQALNAEKVINVRDFSLLGTSLYLAADYNTNELASGTELVKLMAINSQVEFVMGDEVSLEINSGTAISLGQLLSTSEPDIGDTLTWTLNSEPKNGVLSGIPLSLTSDGKIMYPDSITYQSKAEFTGTDVFSLQVSDGLSTDRLTVKVSVLAADTRQTAEDTSGGALGMILWLLSLVFAGRLRYQI